MFNHSLEHVPDPVATLKVAYEKLAAGGMCLARVPTTSSEAWTTYRADWVQADAPSAHGHTVTCREWRWRRRRPDCESSGRSMIRIWASSSAAKRIDVTLR